MYSPVSFVSAAAAAAAAAAGGTAAGGTSEITQAVMKALSGYVLDTSVCVTLVRKSL